MVGGTAEDGRWDLIPDPAIADAILARATTLVPALAGAPIRAHRVGLRPAAPPSGSSPSTAAPDRRPQLRPRRAGVTLSWPCADEVVAVAVLAAGPAHGRITARCCQAEARTAAPAACIGYDARARVTCSASNRWWPITCPSALAETARPNRSS